MDKKEQTRKRVERYRERHKSVTSESVTSEKATDNVTLEIVPASYVQGLTGMYQFLPERPRYVTLSDGQVMDRAYKPEVKPLSGNQIQAIRAMNETLNYRPNTSDTRELREKYDKR